MLAEKWRPFGETIFTTMTQMARRFGAIDLGQGYPNFDGPEWVKEAAIASIKAGENQYPHGIGVPRLRKAVAASTLEEWGLEYDPDTEVTIFSGATEAIFASLQALVAAGDEVLTFAPTYDSYAPSVMAAGGGLKALPLPFPGYEVDMDHLEKMVSKRTRLLILNTPHNPTGKVFTRDELAVLAEFCQKHDLLVLSDEVYEQITLDGARHVPMASLPGMRERTARISSIGKTFSLTGWKVGYITAPAVLTEAVRMPHQFINFATASPMQHGSAVALERGRDYYPALREQYQERLDALFPVLQKAGLEPSRPQGTYFILCDHGRFGFEDDVAFCRHLAEEIGVAAIPPSYFYADRAEGRNLVRFSFCKTLQTLENAAARLVNLGDSGGKGRKM
jgi:N-succinyldiaminopimelate aminotransferase